eukprot:895586-Karenia_brevis.AAC.1
MVPGGPIAPVDMVICASMWMMRGAEAAAVLAEQTHVASDETSATIDLGPTKTNPEGRECPRTLNCCCHSVNAPAPCPVHALVRVLAARRQYNLVGKDALFATCLGTAPSREAVIGTIRKVAGCSRATEHTMRRSGAQYFARNGVDVRHIEFIGRWGAQTVMRYIGQALGQQAATASTQAATRVASPATSMQDLQEQLVALARRVEDGETLVRAVDRWRQQIQSEGGEHALLWESEHRRRLGGVARHRDDKVHEVVVGDAMFPPSVWVTRCGWRFGLSTHIRRGGEPTTCSKCLR